MTGISIRVCSFSRLAKLVFSGVCSARMLSPWNVQVVTVACVKWLQGFKTWNMWTWRPWSLFKPREHSCMGDILMQSDKDAGHRLSFSLSPPLFLSIMHGFRNSHTNRRTAWWGPWNVIMSLPCERSMKWWERPWRLTGSRSWLLWGGDWSRKWHHNRLSLSLFVTRAFSLLHVFLTQVHFLTPNASPRRTQTTTKILKSSQLSLCSHCRLPGADSELIQHNWEIKTHKSLHLTTSVLWLGQDASEQTLVPGLDLGHQLGVVLSKCSALIAWRGGSGPSNSLLGGSYQFISTRAITPQFALLGLTL